ncbi:hypothetical protein D3C76_638540 [compost metagenome]|uniref:Secreted protein n=1 Tax=Pseudomonas jinjuensis TaxID=198616 RepID=A0A1G9YSZ9_9PSED|nr:hypothetical protein [Pseudomonas jinjuensis]SDN12077.1 hypothetical protein SAMN05216193_101190 [Pseudomonas jinjuensis]
MKRTLLATSLLATVALFSSQASFAEESPLMQDRMLQLTHGALQQQQTRQAASSADVEASAQRG